jgi:hypothetical protein
MTEHCVVHFTVTSVGSAAPMDDMRHKARQLLDSLDPHTEWDIKWDITTETVGSWQAGVTARTITLEPDDPRPPKPPRGPR